MIPGGGGWFTRKMSAPFSRHFLMAECLRKPSAFDASGHQKIPSLALGDIFLVAEGEGFEPPETLQPQWFSRPPQSSTLPSLPGWDSAYCSKRQLESQLGKVDACGKINPTNSNARVASGRGARLQSSHSPFAIR